MGEWISLSEETPADNQRVELCVSVDAPYAVHFSGRFGNQPSAHPWQFWRPV